MKCAICKKEAGKNRNGIVRITCSKECHKRYMRRSGGVLK